MGAQTDADASGAAGLGRGERSAVPSAGRAGERGAVRLEQDGGRRRAHIPHNGMRKALADEDLADRQRRKSGQRKWVRRERKYSNSMWHAGYKLLDDGRWLIAYQDDASRFVVGYGVFEEATGKHAVEVLKGAISVHGKPASVLTDRGSWFYAGEKEAAAGGEAEFEKELVALGIRHVLARAGRPQTGGKLARFYGELQRRLPHFVQSAADRTARGGRRGSEAHVGGPFYSAGQTDPVARLIRWHNHDRAGRGSPRRGLRARPVGACLERREAARRLPAEALARRLFPHTRKPVYESGRHTPNWRCALLKGDARDPHVRAPTNTFLHPIWHAICPWLCLSM